MSHEYLLNKEFIEAQHYISIGRYEQAEDKLLSLLSEDPNNALLLYYMAWCQFGKEDYSEVVEYCQQALQNGYAAEECNYLFGKLYMEIKQYKKAEEHYLEALRENPLNADALASYALLMLKTGHNDKASRLIDEALKIEPDNELALRNKYYVRLAHNKREEYYDLLERILIQSDSEVKKHISVGLAELAEKKYKSARENFRQAFLLEPTNLDLLDILKDLDKQTHYIYMPMRLIGKLGGPAVIWIAAMVLITGSFALGLNQLGSIFAISYVSLCVYTWIAPLLYKLIAK